MIASILNLDWLAMPNADWLAHYGAFIAIWTAALFAVQATTLVSAELLTPRFARTAPRLRLLMDLCFTTAVTMLLPTAGLVIVSALMFLMSVVLVFYSRYFMRPLSALTVYHNWREGAKAGRDSAASRFGPTAVVFGSLSLVMIALVLTAPGPGIDRRVIWLFGGAAVAGYLGLIAFAHFKDPPSKIRTTRGIGRVGLIRGYFITWLAEFFYLGSREVRESAIEQRQVVCDALTPLETTIPIREKLAIIQAESLDFNALGLEIGGQEVTPFLNRLRQRSLFYRISAARDTGSADADFIMLNGVLPSPHINTYNIRGYPYRNTLPQFLNSLGYRTAAFHGNTGNFYSRRNAFEKMGFAEIHFLEEMLGDGLPACAWGIEDRQVLDYSARLLRDSSGPTCHFVITMSTHTPYKLLRNVESEIVPHPKTMADDYYNNMRYLDNRLREYIASLGSATVVIYSDHPADSELAPDFVPDCQCRKGHVPCFIFDSDADLGAMQRTREQRMAIDGNLTLLDVSSFLRAQLTASHGAAHFAVPNRSDCQLASDPERERPVPTNGSRRPEPITRIDQQ